MEVTYTRKGDYLFPNLTLQEEPVVIGKYGMLRRTYLKEHKKNLYQSLLMSGKLDSHLQEIERTAQERMENLTENLLKTYPAPNKEAEPMKWTVHMNSLTQMAEETVLTELVYS